MTTEQTKFIEIAALKDYMKELGQRANKLLALQGVEVKPEVHEQLYALGDEIAELTSVLAYAVTAQEMAAELSETLCRKAMAYEEVFNLERPAKTHHFGVTTAVGRIYFSAGCQRSNPFKNESPFEDELLF